MGVVETSSETPQLPLEAFPLPSQEPKRPDFLRPLRFADFRIALTDQDDHDDQDYQDDQDDQEGDKNQKGGKNQDGDKNQEGDKNQ